MPNNISYITKYLSDVIDTIFVTESKTRDLESANKFIDLNFKEAGYVKIMSMLMDGLSDYYRVNNGETADDYSHYQNGTGDGYKVGAVQNNWELFKLRYDRGKQFQIGEIENEQNAGLIVANVLKEFMRTKVVPEVDATRFSCIAEKCSSSLGNLVTETIDPNKIIANFNKAFEWLTEHEVPEEDQIIYVSPEVMTMIRNTTELFKRLSQEEYTKGNVTFTIEKYGNRQIVVVPSTRFFTNVITGANGYFPGTGSKVINYIVCSKRAVVPVVKLHKFKIWTPDAVQNFDGYKINFRIYHDLIIPKNKVIGSYCSVSNTAANTKANLLDLLLSPGSVANSYTVKDTYTTPAGIMGNKLVTAQTAFVVGTAYASATQVVIGADTVDATHTTAYFALLDSTDKAVAVSAQVTLPKKS